MSRDISSWPEVLLKALAPGIAPTLDQLAARTHQVFWSDSVHVEAKWLDTGEEILEIQDLEAAAITVLEGTPVEDKHRALLEMWGLNEYALPFPTSYDTLFGNMLCGAAVPKDIMMDLLYGAIAVRCRLDEATETEDRIRWRMRRLGKKQSRSEVVAFTAALVGKTSLEESDPPFMTFDELVATMQESMDDD